MEETVGSRGRGTSCWVWVELKREGMVSEKEEAMSEWDGK